jgi:hypothetical protein
MRNTREAKVEDVLYDGVVDDLGGLCIKLNPLWYVGIPDRLVLLPGGRIFFIELKIRSGRYGSNQVWWRTTLRSLGFKCETLWTVEAVNQFLASVQ